MFSNQGLSYFFWYPQIEPQFFTNCRNVLRATNILFYAQASRKETNYNASEAALHTIWYIIASYEKENEMRKDH